MTESLNKRETARRSVYSVPRFRPKEFDIKLSEHHLLDTVRDYCVKNKRSGKEKLDVCLERMVESGVVSESAYSRPDAEATVSFLFKYVAAKPGFDLTFSNLYKRLTLFLCFNMHTQILECIAAKPEVT
jgi:hypothetical protein